MLNVNIMILAIAPIKDDVKENVLERSQDMWITAGMQIIILHLYFLKQERPDIMVKYARNNIFISLLILH